jgi:hypothetical protein
MINNSTTNPPRPMGDLNAAMRDLDLDADRIRALLDEGKLIGFNISTNKSARICLRLLTKSVEHYRQTGGKKPLVLEWPQMFRLVLKHDKLWLRGLEIQRALNCDEGHVASLILAGYFVLMKKSHPGHGGSPIVTRGSFEAFLKGRLL